MLNEDFKEFVGLLNSNRVDVVELDGQILNFIALEDFKTNKRASGRHKDLADLDALDDATPAAD